MDDLAVGGGSKDKSEGGLVVDGAVVHDASKAGAGPGAGLVDAEQGGEQAHTATDLYQVSLPVGSPGEEHHHEADEGHSDGWHVGGDGLEVVEGGGGGADTEPDGEEHAAEDEGEEDVLLGEGGVLDARH